MSLTIPHPDHRDIPVGGVLGFPPDKVPDNWVVFDGRVLIRAEYPELLDMLERTREHTEKLWNRMGGSRINYKAWRTPNPSSDEAWGALGMPDMGIDLVLAQKAKPDPNE